MSTYYACLIIMIYVYIVSCNMYILLVLLGLLLLLLDLLEFNNLTNTCINVMTIAILLFTLLILILVVVVEEVVVVAVVVAVRRVSLFMIGMYRKRLCLSVWLFFQANGS